MTKNIFRKIPSRDPSIVITLGVDTRKTVFMNEFLLITVVLIYVAIRY
jgi:hypothetical protein